MGDGRTKVIILAGDGARSTTGDDASHAGTELFEKPTSHYGNEGDASEFGSTYSRNDYNQSEQSSAI